MKHLGSVTDINGGEILPVDIITFGSPCQDMSVAGKRAGMQHLSKGDEDTTRSGLFYEAVRIIKEMREKTNGEYPKFAIWENVPGAFTSNGGEDFLCVLKELFAFCSEEEFSIPRPANGKWTSSGEIVGDRGSIAWRTLDAQYWGVPQRRKRIYLVADFNSHRAGKILFERDCMFGNPAQGRKAGQETANDVAGSSGRGCIAFAWANSAGAGITANEESTPTIKAARCGEPAVAIENCSSVENDETDHVKCLTPWDCQSKRQYTVDGVYRTLDAGQSSGGQAHGVVYSAAFMGGQGVKSGGIGYSDKVSPTIKSVLSGSNTVPDVVFAVDCRNMKTSDELSSTLQAKGNGGYSLNYQNPVCYVASSFAGYEEGNPILRASGGDAGGGSEGIICALRCFETEYVDHGQISECGEPILASGKQSSGTLLACASTKMWLGNQEAFSGDYSIIHKAQPPRRYIIRRLIPIECARLQGFPDCWGIPDFKSEFTDEELAFWHEVRRVYALVNDKKYKKPKDSSLLKWYNKLHTDSAEYKMWGNGIALPCAEYVVGGVVDALMYDSQ